MLSDSLINLTSAGDGERPSKSRRKVAEMIDDLNVALGLKKADAERLEKKRRKQEAKERQKGIRVGHLLLHEWIDSSLELLSVLTLLVAISGAR